MRYDRHRRRVYLWRCRVHHGLIGLLLVVTGVWLVAHDRADFPWLPLPDTD